MSENGWAENGWPRPDVVVHDPGGLGHKITTLWAFLAVEHEDSEGIVASIERDRITPMVTGEPANIDRMRKAVQEVATVTGKTIKLVRFEGRVEEEEITP